MWDTRPVELSVDLPAALADSVEEVTAHDPAYLRRVIRYGIARRAVYQALTRQIELGDSSLLGEVSPDDG